MFSNTIPGRYPLIEINNLLTNEECEQFIHKANTIKTDGHGSEAWHAPGTGGEYDRVIMVDDKLADALWLKIQPLLPKTHRGFTLLEINDHFRISRYHDGGSFTMHCDGKNYARQRSHTTRKNHSKAKMLESLYTLNIFLNDDFKGGETKFFTQTGKNKFDLRHTITPQTGRAGLFLANQYHCGAKVSTNPNTKYLLRTDVMGCRFN